MLRSRIVIVSVLIGLALAGVAGMFLGEPILVVGLGIASAVLTYVLTRQPALLRDRVRRRTMELATAYQQLEGEIAQRERAERTARTLAEIGNEIVATLDVVHASDRIVTAVLERFQARRSLLFERDEDTDSLVCIAVAGGGDQRRWIGRIVPAGVGVAGRVAVAGRDDMPEWARELAQEEGNGSVAAAPLVARGKVIGVLGLGDAPGRIFSDQEVELLSAFADQAALALHNSRLYERAEGRAKKLTALNTLTRSITAATDSREVCDTVAQATTTLLGARMTRVWIDDPAAGVLRVQGMFTVDPRADYPAVSFATLPRGAGILGEALASRAPQYVVDVQRDPRMANPRLAEAADFHAAAVIPLIAGERVLGGLYVYFGARSPFTPDEKELLSLLAAQAAIAIQNTQLYEAQETRASRLHALAHLNHLISSSLDLDEVLRAIARAASKLMDAEVVSFWVADEQAETVEARAYSDDAVARDFPLKSLRFGEGTVGWVALHRQPLDIPDVFADERIQAPEWWRARGLRSLLAIPIEHQDTLLGVLSLSGVEPFRFGPDDRELIESFAAQAAVAIANARLYRERARAHEELSETQEQLVQAQKMEAVGRLAGGIAHDFNNLLTIISGHTQLIGGQLRPEDPLSRRIKLLDETARRAAALVRQLLAFSRKQLLQPRVLDLGEVVQSTATMLRRVLGEDIELTCGAEPGLWRVKADPAQLEQVIMNLVVNARDAMPQGGRLSVETANVEVAGPGDDGRAGTPPGAWVMLAVTDTGIGMDERTRARIFEPFFTTKAAGQGTGLGLSTVYGIVTQHNGHIAVESEPGRGSTFRIYLPRVQEEPEAAARAEPAPVRGSGTILLVEDEQGVRELAREILEINGYTVLEAVSPGDALLIAERHTGPIRLILTDVVMPHMSGRELVERLLPLRPDMRVLYMSGYTDDAIANHGILHPGTRLLEKPFTPDALVRKIHEALA